MGEVAVGEVTELVTATQLYVGIYASTRGSHLEPQIVTWPGGGPVTLHVRTDRRLFDPDTSGIQSSVYRVNFAPMLGYLSILFRIRRPQHIGHVTRQSPPASKSAPHFRALWSGCFPAVANQWGMIHRLPIPMTRESIALRRTALPRSASQLLVTPSAPGCRCQSLGSYQVPSTTWSGGGGRCRGSMSLVLGRSCRQLAGAGPTSLRRSSSRVQHTAQNVPCSGHTRSQSRPRCCTGTAALLQSPLCSDRPQAPGQDGTFTVPQPAAGWCRTLPQHGTSSKHSSHK